ncbi:MULTISPECIES: GerAB/ArcD/ProY family transporter [Paenibacillus]|uniref:GerAB/ArcD/ProY family transporter n=1 Tax=Paenibacillus phytohabitans TaxID=2654978 RepID=A0ABX1YJS1_9BACL|nr:GerAB/ArcD/ProY family transporter [Paenibacillus phytohabitans]NOU81202.1 GerAB/ArcD/ProY family transporter [Paenibacillus phytohabitans]
MPEKLRPFHIAVLMHMTQSGIVIFTLPRNLADYFGTNGWLFLVPCIVVSTFNIYLISLVFRLGQGRSVFEIMEQTIPRPVLYPFYGGLAAVWLVFGCMIGKKYVLIFQMLSFPTTNPMVFKLAVDILAFLMITKGIYSISKAATLFFWLSAWMYLLMLWFFPAFRWERLTPFILKGGHNQFKGAMEIYSAFLGYELSILLFPYVNKNKKAMAGVYAGNLYLAVLYISLAIICFGFFSLGQLKKLLYPLLDLLAYIQFPFIERLENLLYGLFLFPVLVTVVMYWWAAQESVRRMLPRIKLSVLSFLLIAISYSISFIPKTLDAVGVWITNLGYAVTGIAFGFPVLLLLLLLIQRKGGEVRA